MSGHPAKRIKILPKPPMESSEIIIPNVEYTPNFPTSVRLNEIKTEMDVEPSQIDSNVTIPIQIKSEPLDYEEMDSNPHSYDIVHKFSAGTSMDFVNANLKMKIEPTDSERLSELIPKKIYKKEMKEKRDFGTDMTDAAFETKDFSGQVDFGPDVQVKEIQTLPILYETFSCQVDFPEEG